MCGGRCNRSGPSLDKGPKEGRNTWALGQGEVTEEQEAREGMRLAQACLCPKRSLVFTHGSSFLSSLTSLDNFGKPPPSVSVGKMHMKPHLELWVVFWDHRGSPQHG